MDPTLKALHDKMQALVDEAKALKAVAQLDEQQIERAASLTDEIGTTKAQIAALTGLAGASASADEFLNGRTGEMLRSLSSQISDKDAREIAQVEPEDLFRATKALVAGGLTPFMSSIMDDRAQARRYALGFAHYLSAISLQPSHASRDWCEKNGINWRAASGHSEGVNEDGGFLVPEEFEAAIIVLRERFGVFRQFAEIVPMARETKWSARRIGGVTVYPVGEGDAITKSKTKHDRVELVARKWAALAYDTSELDEDSMVRRGDLMLAEFAHGFSKKEDECGFNGDGTADFHGIVGARQKLLDKWTTAPSAGDGLVLGAGNLWSELTMANFHDAQGNLPEYAERDAAWYCHKRFWSTVLMKLALAAGGVPAAEIMMGGQKKFLGDPVRVCQAMPNTEANSQVCVIYGSLNMAAKLGDRRGLTIAESLHNKFETDELTYRAISRYDIKVHSVETPDDSTKPGPIVGIVTAAA